jgi:hypothetical protein
MPGRDTARGKVLPEVRRRQGLALCGTANAPGDQFCKECGRRLIASQAEKVTGAGFAAPEAYTPKRLAEKILISKSALEGERKQVTVLFADLKGSMELLADRDPEEARKLLDPVLERQAPPAHGEARAGPPAPHHRDDDVPRDGYAVLA